jgi:hypothetical protein
LVVIAQPSSSSLGVYFLPKLGIPPNLTLHASAFTVRYGMKWTTETAKPAYIAGFGIGIGIYWIVLEECMAEREGFEPPIALRLWLISSQLHSTGLCHLSSPEIRFYLTVTASRSAALVEWLFTEEHSAANLRETKTACCLPHSKRSTPASLYPRRDFTASAAFAVPFTGTSGISTSSLALIPSFLRSSLSIRPKISLFSFRKPRTFSRPCPMRSPL